MSRLILLFLSAVLVLCASCVQSPPPPSDSSPAVVSVTGDTGTDSPANVEPMPEPKPVPEPEPLPDPVPAPEPTPDPVPAPEPTPEQAAQSEPDGPPDHTPALSFPVLSAYDFTVPVPERPAVDDSYFADAVFVGDSRTDGFWRFSGVRQGKRLTSDGLSVFTLDKTRAINVNGTAYTVLDALAMDDYAKVYLCLGVNELGYRDLDAFYLAYCQAIDAVRTCQPNAVIYVQTLIPLNESKVAASGGFGYLKNDRLRTYNELIRKAAAEKQVPLLDLYTHFAIDGQLPADASRDGVHLMAPYCKKQLEYFRTHTVDFQTLYAPPEEQTTEPPAPDPDAPDRSDTPDTSDVPDIPPAPHTPDVSDPSDTSAPSNTPVPVPEVIIP